MYTTHPTHGAGARPTKTQGPTATRLTTPNADQCVHQPKEGQREEQANPPPKEKTGGRGTRKAHSHEAAHPHQKRPPSQTVPKVGPPEGTPEDHPPKTGDTKPKAAANQKQGHPKHADTHHARAETEENKTTTTNAAQPKREGKGGRRPQDPRPGQPPTDTTKPRHDTPKRPPPQKKNKRGGGGSTSRPQQHPHTPKPEPAPEEGDGKQTRRTQEATRPSIQARKPGKPESR